MWWWGRGRGWWWWFWNPFIQYMASRGYYYIGPCRSGFGPFAFYITPTGQIVHAWQLFTPYYYWPFVTPFYYGPYYTTPVTDEKSYLEEQKRLLENQLKDINRRLAELEGEKSA
ncbi:MAG: DUF5320 domain-containing protein [Candidatus Asgardarchaeia archaeon]